MGAHDDNGAGFFGGRREKGCGQRDEAEEEKFDLFHGSD